MRLCAPSLWHTAQALDRRQARRTEGQKEGDERVARRGYIDGEWMKIDGQPTSVGEGLVYGWNVVAIDGRRAKTVDGQTHGPSPPTAHSLGSSALAGSLPKLWPLPRTVHGWIRLVAGRCGWMRMDVDAQGASLLWVLIHLLAFAGLQRDIHMLAPNSRPFSPLHLGFVGFLSTGHFCVALVGSCRFASSHTPSCLQYSVMARRAHELKPVSPNLWIDASTLTLTFSSQVLHVENSGRIWASACMHMLRTPQLPPQFFSVKHSRCLGRFRIN